MSRNFCWRPLKSFLNDRAPIQKNRECVESGIFNQSLWKEMVALGWNGVNIEAQYGGLGLSLENLVPIFETMGRHLVSSPLMASSIASEPLLHKDEEKKSDLPVAHSLGRTSGTVFYEENGGLGPCSHRYQSRAQRGLRDFWKKMLCHRCGCCFFFY